MGPNQASILTRSRRDQRLKVAQALKDVALAELRGESAPAHLGRVEDRWLALLEADHAVVEPDRACVVEHRVGRDLLSRPVPVHLLDALRGIGEEVAVGVRAAAVLLEVRRVQVLDDVHGVAGHLRVEAFERGPHVWHLVAPVVEDDVRHAKLLDESAEERGVGLVADTHVDAGRLVPRALGVDIDTDDGGIRPEVALPHLERPALRHPDLEHRDGPVDPRGEVALVDREVMPPLVDDLVVVAHEVLPEGSHCVSIYSGGRSTSVPTNGDAAAECVVQTPATTTISTTRKSVTDGWIQPFRGSVTPGDRVRRHDRQRARQPPDRRSEEDAHANPSAASCAVDPSSPFRASSSMCRLCAWPNSAVMPPLAAMPVPPTPVQIDVRHSSTNAGQMVSRPVSPASPANMAYAAKATAAHPATMRIQAGILPTGPVLVNVSTMTMPSKAAPTGMQQGERAHDEEDRT